MRTIKGSVDLSDIKRCNIETQIKGKCPVCKSEVVFDFENDYISYPVTEDKGEQSGYCSNCKDFVLMPYVIKEVEVTIECSPEFCTMDK